MTAEPLAPTPDDKDWTWVLGEPCPECGFDATAIAGTDAPRLVRGAVASFVAALARPGAAVRPAPEVWSPLEYGCHVRDVCAIFDERLRLMLTEDDPLFANWDQDASAVERGYWKQDPAAVAGELAVSGERIASAFAAVEGAQWRRPGRRPDQSFGRRSRNTGSPLGCLAEGNAAVTVRGLLRSSCRLASDGLRHAPLSLAALNSWFEGSSGSFLPIMIVWDFPLVWQGFAGWSLYYLSGPVVLG